METEEGKEALEFVSNIISVGQTVQLELDVKPRGPYRRLLVYVWLEKEMLNNILVREGYAQVATYPPNVKYKDLFIQSQKDARVSKKGLWK